MRNNWPASVVIKICWMYTTSRVDHTIGENFGSRLRASTVLLDLDQDADRASDLAARLAGTIGNE